MEKNNAARTPTGPSSPTDSDHPPSQPDSSTPPPPPYVQPIPIPPRPLAATEYPWTASLPFRGCPQPSTMSMYIPSVKHVARQEKDEKDEEIEEEAAAAAAAIKPQREDVPDVIQKGFHPSFVHRPPTPKPVYADFGGRWVCKDENDDSSGDER
ncbi:hypothetical protein AYO21_06612 [Fonsecaea monophora]|uniref:Uncharacterized protein n=1 Tax=Fonsecaea monophora TaxID=254056 RepID=A0A177F7A2_9EURO|nr:hypothetical protein AYO21_06612 [Fonsecaea monophora]KAH0841123.1 hypothetical protein FOPE_06563 [Fonsecaea pedrosoi]OAG39229.1 hypothetical protein AYO21_06612 [Fonsecaea monophora]